MAKAKQGTNPKLPNAKPITFMTVAVLAAGFGGGFAWVWNRLDSVFGPRYVAVAALGWIVVWSLAFAAVIFVLFRWINRKFPGAPAGERDI